MAITLDGNTIDKLMLIASNGSTVMKNLVETGNTVSVDKWGIYNNELLDTWGNTLNLKDDTNFDGLTPGTTTSNIIANNESTKTIDVELSAYAYFIIHECFIKASYQDTPGEKAFAKAANIHMMALTRTVGGQNSVIGTTLSGMPYLFSNGELLASPNASSYGIYESAPTGAYKSSGSMSTEYTLNTPRWNMRGSASYAPVPTLEAIDSANSFIQYRFSIYRMPTETLYLSASAEAKYILDNEGLRQ